MKRFAAVFSAVFAFVLTALLFALPVLCADTVTEGITSVTLIREKDIIKLDLRASLSKAEAENRKGETLYIFELYPYQSVSTIETETPVGQVKAAENMAFTLDFETGSQRIYSKFLLARKQPDGSYSIFGWARYIENPQLLAAETYDYPTYPSKKGLIVQLTSDAQELGISHTVINVAVNEYLLDAKSANSIDYIYDNTTYYLNREKLERLDYRIKQFTEAGIHCYLNIILSRPAQDMPQKLSCLYAAPEVTTASLYAFDVANRDSVMYLESFLDFIARRYTASDRQYGFAGSFIFGYEVNRNRGYNYMGAKSLDSYLNSYITAFRIASTALRSVYANGRIYLSIGNNFNVASGDPAITADASLDYSARNLLEAFAAKVRYSGDIPWGIAASAYPSEPNITDFRQDTLVSDTVDTPYISMANIDVLCDLMGKDEYLYLNNRRNLVISEFGISAEADSSALITQAAIYALAYYKTAFNPYIEALIYHRQVDNADETGLYYGLWTKTVDSFCTPANTKPIYTTFKYIDTQRSLLTTSYALSLLKIESWNELIPNFDEKALTKRYLLDSEALDIVTIEKKKHGEILYDFTTGGLSGFYPTDNADYIELRSGAMDDLSMLYAKMYSQYPTEYMGTGCYFDIPMVIKDSGFISLKINAAAPENVSEVSMMIRLYSNGVNGKANVTYEGITTIKVNVWSQVGFDISEIADYSNTIDGIKIWIKPTDNIFYEGEYGFWLHSISMHGRDFPLILSVLLWLVLIIVIAAAILLIYILIRRILIRRYKQKKKAEAETKFLLMKAQQRQAQLLNRSAPQDNTGQNRSPNRPFEGPQKNPPAGRPSDGTQQNNPPEQNNPPKRRPPDNRSE